MSNIFRYTRSKFLELKLEVDVLVTNSPMDIPQAIPDAQCVDETVKNFLDDDDGDDCIKDINVYDVERDAAIAKANELFEKNVTMLNSEQRAIFDMVKNHIQSELDRGDLSGAHDNIGSKLRVFITGGAGTGKTFLLKLIQQLIQRMYDNEDSVHIGAITGAAAILIEGKTLHSMFKLPVHRTTSSSEKKKNDDYIDMTKLEKLKIQWANSKFLIIDEVSMVSYQIFRTINSRLKLIAEGQHGKKSTDLFGRMNVITFGDLFQLNPISGNLIYNQTQKQSERGEPFLWRYFDFIELKENMRQKDDQPFIRLLNNARYGRLTRADEQVLMSRLRRQSDIEEFSESNANSIKIVATNKEANQYNSNKLEKLVEETGVKIFQITAVDRFLKPEKVEILPATYNVSKNEFDTGGFPETVVLAEGAKVMLRYNISVERGLVNGSVGIVKEVIHHTKSPSEKGDVVPYTVVVDFGSKTGVRKIPSICITFDSSQPYVEVERTQIPLILAWAVTSHKLQGATLDRAVITLGERTFCPGQPYVMLSRCRSLAGLVFDQLTLSKIRDLVNMQAVKEIKRLRSDNSKKKLKI